MPTAGAVAKSACASHRHGDRANKTAVGANTAVGVDFAEGSTETSDVFKKFSDIFSEISHVFGKISDVFWKNSNVFLDAPTDGLDALTSLLKVASN